MQDIDKLAWICIQQKKVLVARSKGKPVFYMPGGKRDPGETDAQALVREIKEELSVDLKPETLSYVHQIRAQAHGKPEGVMVKITCYSGEFEGAIQPAAEIEEVRWVGSKDPGCSPTAQIIVDWLAERKLIQ